MPLWAFKMLFFVTESSPWFFLFSTLKSSPFFQQGYWLFFQKEFPQISVKNRKREVLRLTFVEVGKIALLALKIPLSLRKKWNGFKMTRRVRFQNLSSIKSKPQELLGFKVFDISYKIPKVSIKFDCSTFISVTP